MRIQPSLFPSPFFALPGPLFQVLKIAILSEKFAIEYAWYVDVILNIISQAGDFVSDDVYHRVVQIVTNNEDIQKHSADLVFKVLDRGVRWELDSFFVKDRP